MIRHHSTTGFSLIELLISLLVLSLLLECFNALQWLIVKQNKINTLQFIASEQLTMIYERLKLSEHEACCQQQQHWWNVSNATMLPNGYGTVHGHYPHYQVVIYWGQSSRKSCLHVRNTVKGCVTMQLTM